MVYVADTVDRFARPGEGTIAPGVQTNLRNVSAFFQDAARRLGLSYEPIEVRSELRPGQPDQFDCSNVMQTVEGAAQNSADVIVFYYAGHGENRLDAQGRITANVLGPDGRPIPVPVAAETPYMTCTGVTPRPNLLNISERLQSAGPRLLVVMFDSCNSLGEYEPFSTPAAAPRARDRLVDERLADASCATVGSCISPGPNPASTASTVQKGGSPPTNFWAPSWPRIQQHH